MLRVFLQIAPFFILILNVTGYDQNMVFPDGGRLHVLGMIDPPTARPSISNNLQLSASRPVDRWFTQKLDNFDPFNTKSWKQVIIYKVYFSEIKLKTK